MRGLPVLAFYTVVALGDPLQVSAQPRPVTVSFLEANNAVAAAVYQTRLTDLATERQAGNGQIVALGMRLRSTQKHLREAEAAGASDRTDVTTLRAELVGQQQAFVALLEKTDRAYGDAIADFRGAVVDIAKTPEGVRALLLYNAGSRTIALEMLQRIEADQEAAIDREAVLRANIEKAAGRRRIATLMLDDRAKGGAPTAAAIAQFESVIAIDPGVQWDWVNLSRLYRDAGRFPDALHAAEVAVRSAPGDRDRAAALSELGDVDVSMGDLVGARRAYEDGLSIARRMAAVKPANAEGQRDLSISLDRLGDVLRQLKDFVVARKAYDESLVIRRALVAADPTNAQARRDVSVSLEKLGDVLTPQGDLPTARKDYEESLSIYRELAAAAPANANAQRDVSVALERLGESLLSLGDLQGASKAFEESAGIARTLAAADPTNVRARLDVAAPADRLGDVLVRLGDPTGARQAYETGLAVYRPLSISEPANARVKRNLGVILAKLAALPDSGVTWREAVAPFEALVAAGQLAPGDQAMFTDLRRRAAEEAGRSPP